MAVPSTVRPGIAGTFTLSCYSDGPVSLRKLADERRSVMTGEWTEESAGGSHLNDSWPRNPCFFLHIPPPCAFKPSITVKLSLTPISSNAAPRSSSRPKSAWAARQRKDALGSMIGLYIFKVPAGARGPFKLKDLDRSVVETKFVPADSVSLTLDLLPSADPFVIVPATYGKGESAPWENPMQSPMQFGPCLMPQSLMPFLCAGLVGPFWLEVAGNLEFVLHGR